MDGLLTKEQVAEVLQTNPRTVLVWAARGELPAVRISRLVRFRPDDIAAWIENHLQPGSR